MEFSNSRVLLLIQGSLCALWKVRFNFQALVSSFIKEIIDPSDLRLVPLKSFLGQLSKQSIRFMGSWDQFQRNAVWPSLKLVNFNFRNEEVLSVKFFQIGEVQLQRGSRVVDMWLVVNQTVAFPQFPEWRLITQVSIGFPFLGVLLSGTSSQRKSLIVPSIVEENSSLECPPCGKSNR